jgi:hypothetical protein
MYGDDTEQRLDAADLAEDAAIDLQDEVEGAVDERVSAAQPVERDGAAIRPRCRRRHGKEQQGEQWQ